MTTLLLALSLLSTPAQAVLVPGQILGKTIVELPVAGKRAELCVIPENLPGGKYGKSDEKKLAELCSYEVGVSVAACPKTYSTNPGVLFVRQKKDGQDFSAAICQAKEETLSKRAKYKLSTSCSYTPSILAYFHVSRSLGNILNVPVATLRTMDLDRHLGLARTAMKKIDPRELIYKTWAGLRSNLEQGKNSSKRDLLFVEGYDQSYGALQWNPKGEEFYKEFFNGGTDRIATFKAKNAIYRAIRASDLNVGREFNAANVQAMQRLKDLGDWLVLDTILGQQDRMGNIHYETKFFYVENKDGKFKVKSESDKKDVPAELLPTALEIKEMTLKDNDCGVAKENRIKAAKLLDSVAHLDPGTYQRVLKLDASMDQDKEIYLGGMQFTEADFRTVRQNVSEAARMLKAACESGKLKLDLDLDKHFAGVVAVNKCERKD